MSKNHNGHCTGTTRVAVKSHGKERLKKKALK